MIVLQRKTINWRLATPGDAWGFRRGRFDPRKFENCFNCSGRSDDAPCICAAACHASKCTTTSMSYCKCVGTTKVNDDNRKINHDASLDANRIFRRRRFFTAEFFSLSFFSRSKIINKIDPKRAHAHNSSRQETIKWLRSAKNGEKNDCRRHNKTINKITKKKQKVILCWTPLTHFAIKQFSMIFLHRHVSTEYFNRFSTVN